ncbi:hypothetical protein KFL_005510080 [Klebsormidium nitens]|uniref:Uncharacterized protein n=1 Tax=Klebsormidium nitens TaxID=105231 RepID=A0A1Y1IGD0_KLENI|nr:hypothetical protein KFL_005510080 [Klebsormidium nitens]|eukprot:GAQ89693.1 hypothetical protein KFL_005510080 [Klebsormidium nitens]
MGPETLRPGRGSAGAFFGHGFPLCDVFALDIPFSASPLTVALYMTFLLRTAKSPSPVLSCSGAIFFHHSLAGLPSPTQHPMVAMARQIARRTLTKGKNQKKPLLASHVFRLFDIWYLSPSADHLSSAMKLAAISLCYTGFFRFSDLMTV